LHHCTLPGWMQIEFYTVRLVNFGDSGRDCAFFFLRLHLKGSINHWFVCAADAALLWQGNYIFVFCLWFVRYISLGHLACNLPFEHINPTATPLICIVHWLVCLCVSPVLAHWAVNGHKCQNSLKRRDWERTAKTEAWFAKLVCVVRDNCVWLLTNDTCGVSLLVDRMLQFPCQACVRVGGSKASTKSHSVETSHLPRRFRICPDEKAHSLWVMVALTRCWSHFGFIHSRKG